MGTEEPVEFTAAAAAVDGEPPKSPTFAALAYTGGTIPGYTLTPRAPHPYVFDLSSMKNAKNMHANLDHKTERRVGHLTAANNNGKEIRVEGVLSAATAYRDEVLNSHQGGMPWEVSIEVAIGRLELIPKGKSATINGQVFHGPVYRAINNRLTDIAFVSHGADGGNEVKIAASTAKETEMNPFEQFMAACGVDPDAVSDEHRARLQAAFDAEQLAARTGKPGSGTHKSFSEVVAEQKADVARRDTIAKLAQDAMRQHPVYIDQIQSMAELAMEKGATPDEFELDLYRGMQTIRGGIVSTSRSNPMADPKIIEAAICMASGLPEIEKHFSEEVLHNVERAGLRNFGLQQLLITAACSNGYSSRAGERIHNGNIREILEYAFPPISARLTGFSSISMSGILGNVANKEILAGYMEEDTTWKEIATIKSVSNFQQYTSYRMLDSLEYEQVGPTGFIPHGTLAEESYTRQAKTYAKMLGITREQIINDDLGAFDDVRTRLGRGGAKKFANIFWAAFMDNAAFFTTALTNYLAGATTNLGTDGVGLGLGLLTYRKMTSPTTDGTKRVGASMSRPEILLAPPELEGNARLAYTSSGLISGANAVQGNNNIYQGLFRPVIQNRLSDSAFTGWSATAWYLFGQELKPMVVSFLNGQQTPTVESSEADFNQLGIQFRGYHDFGADKSEYLAGAKLKGIA